VSNIEQICSVGITGCTTSLLNIDTAWSRGEELPR